MCGRYLTPDEAALERAFGLSAPDAYRQSWNLAPSQPAPVVVAGAGGPKLRMLEWGFRPHWAKRAWINARSETVLGSKAFAEAARRRRCLVPAVGWYEWQGDEPPRQPWLIHLDGFRPFAFAGIFTPDGTDRPAGFAILTADAAGDLAAIHGRMPVVVDAADHARWLAAGSGRAAVGEILADRVLAFAAYKVSSYVNKPEHSDAACIEPI